MVKWGLTSISRDSSYCCFCGWFYFIQKIFTVAVNNHMHYARNTYIISLSINLIVHEWLRFSTKVNVFSVSKIPRDKADASITVQCNATQRPVVSKGVYCLSDTSGIATTTLPALRYILNRSKLSSLFKISL
jgi:hypothetical protein